MKTLDMNHSIPRRKSAPGSAIRVNRGRGYWRMMMSLVPVFALLFSFRATAGTWIPLVNQAPDNIDTMLLLSDGTVMAASGQTSSGNIGNIWYRLTPDIHGSYINGTWTTLAGMNDTRLYYASEVLQDGRLFVAGAEYGTGGMTGEIYNPINNTWTRLPDPGQNMIDCESRVLPNGNVLVAPVLPNPGGATIIYNPFINAWIPGGVIVRGFTLDEAAWIKLPDDSILTLDTPGTGTNSERYIPAQNQWVSDADLPVFIWDLVKFEMGPGFLLPDGRGFYLGSSSHTAFYTPSGSTSPGSWTAGADIPNAQGMPDAPGAMMATGKILVAVGPNGNVGGQLNFPGPTQYYEFDPVTNGFTAESTPDGQVDPDPPFLKRMLCLPDGSVLLSKTSPQVYAYIPTGTPVASGKPTIQSISPNPDGSFHLTGTLLNGISEGAQYGDDAQENSNYPIIRMTDSKGNVFYVRTFNWSSTSVATGNAVLSTEFTVPAEVPPGTYSLVVTANGISSDPVAFSGAPTPNLQVAGTSIVGGNGNGIIDFDECNSLFITLTNVGATNAHNVTATLFTSTPGVTIAQASAAYPNIAVGDSGTNLSPFQISTSPKFVCGTPVSLTLVIKTAEVTATRFFTLPSGTVGVPIRYDNDTPTNIPPNPQGAASFIQVSNFDSSLLHVAVSTFVQDGFDIDLTLELIGPDGTKVTLSQQNGGSGQNYGIDCANDLDRTTFDDNANVSIQNGQSPFLGSFTPQSALAAFIGKTGTNVNGRWELHAVDPFQGDLGAIECWSLFLTPAACVDGGGQCPGVDIAIGMKSSPNPVTAQSPLTYTITITNLGPDTATNVALSQTLPSSVSFVSAVCSQGSANFANNTVSGSLGTLFVGDSATVTVTVIPQTTGTIFSTATAGSSQNDPNTANNTITVATLVVSPSADLGVSLLANPNPVLLNGVLTYTATVINHGPAAASNVLVTNTLPLNASFVAASTSQGTFANSANLVVASLGDLAVGSNAVITMQVRPQVIGQVTAKSSVSSAVSDPAPANNTATVNVNVTAASDLVLSMTGPASVVVGSNITYQLNVLNLGPSPATSVNLRDTLPAGLTLLSSNSPLGTISVSNNVVSCLFGNLGVNSNATLTLTVGTSVTNTVVNNASVSASQADPNNTNNSASVTTIVTFPNVNVVAAGFQLVGESFLPTNGMIESGEQVTLLLKLQNLGNVDSAANLTATLLSSNGVVPAGSQVKNYGTLTASGPAVAQPFTFTATGAPGSSITANLQVQNNGTNLTVVKFPFVLALSNSFANTGDIIIPDHGPSQPYYPVTNIVSGVSNLVGKVTVTFTNFNHTFPDDVDILLVGPTGQNVLLMSHTGSGGVLSNAFLEFDQGVTNGDGTPKLLPISSGITPGLYQPTQNGSVNFSNTFGGTIVVPSNRPPPFPPYGTNLAQFNGTSANGAWYLYVFDSSQGDQGIIRGGWSLGIVSGASVNPVVDLGVVGTASPSTGVAGSTLTYTFTVTNSGPNTASVAQFTNVLPANVTFVSATNSAHTPTVLAGGAVSCNFTNLAAGASASVTVVVVPNGGGVLASTATVSGSDNDPNQSNNSFTVNTTVNAPTADIVLAMTGPTNAVIGSNTLYSITVTNNGPGTALNVVVTDPLQGVLAFASGNSSGTLGAPATNGAGAVVCNVGNLAPGAGASISLFLFANNPVVVSNTVTATTGSSDPNLANNSATIVTAFSAPAPVIVPGTARLVSGPANGSLVPGQPATVSFALANIGTADTSNLVATLLATNGVNSPSGPQTYGVLVHGGPAVANNYSFTVSGANGGVVSPVLQLNDGAANLGTVTFSFNLPVTNTFANTNLIIIPDHGPAGPYPATITVSNLAGVVTKATVTLNNYSHHFPNDVQILLAGPSGANLVLESGDGGANSITNVTLTFDDAAGRSLPASTDIANGSIVSGTYVPTENSLAMPFPSPAPASTTGTFLATFGGTVPNGDWQLFVFDTTPGDDGNIANGWSLSLTSISPVNSAADVGVSLSSSSGTVFAGLPLTFNVGVSNKGPSDAANVTVTNFLPVGLSFVSTTLGSFTSPTNGEYIFNAGTVTAGSSTNFSVTVRPATGGAFNTTASIGSDQTDVNLADNTARLTLQASSGPRLSVSSGATNGAFALTVSVNGEPGTYQIVATTNLQLPLSNWTTVATITNHFNSFQFTDTNAAQYPYRYYRAIFLP